MRREEFRLSVHKYDLCGVWFLPDGEVQATAHLMHGQGDFTQRYHEVAQVFCAHGIAVCGMDLPGHGLSSGKRGDVPSMDYVKEVSALLRLMIESRFPAVQRGLMAHSMGGLLALHELVRDTAYYDFCWISSPLIDPAKNKSAGEVRLLEQLAKVFPKLTVSTGVKRDLCRRVSEEKEGMHKSNPLFHKKISLRWGKALIEAAETLKGVTNTAEIRTKTLLTQGGKDPVTPLAYAEEFQRRAGWEGLEMAVIPQALHEPFRDVMREEFFLLINDWLESEVLRSLP